MSDKTPMLRKPMDPEALEAMIRGIVRQELDPMLPRLATAAASATTGEVDLIRWDDDDGLADGDSYPVAGLGITPGRTVLMLPLLDGFPLIMPGPRQQPVMADLGIYAQTFAAQTATANGGTATNASNSTYITHGTTTITLPSGGQWTVLVTGSAVYSQSVSGNGANSNLRLNGSLGTNSLRTLDIVGVNTKLTFPHAAIWTGVAGGNATLLLEYKANTGDTGTVSAWAYALSVLAFRTAY